MALTYAQKRRLQRIASTFNARARKLRAPGVVSWQMLLSLGSECAYDGTLMSINDGSYDHVIPFENGGTNHITNIVRCCMTCQRTKYTKTPIEFAQHRALEVTCARPGCGNTYQPRWAEYTNGRARYCSHACAGWARARKGA
jgi:5-methylcytosine-specific restriction endonuclease McrA